MLFRSHADKEKLFLNLLHHNTCPLIYLSRRRGKQKADVALSWLRQPKAKLPCSRYLAKTSGLHPNNGQTLRTKLGSFPAARNANEARPITVPCASSRLDYTHRSRPKLPPTPPTGDAAYLHRRVARCRTPHMKDPRSPAPTGPSPN